MQRAPGRLPPPAAGEFLAYTWPRQEPQPARRAGGGPGGGKQRVCWAALGRASRLLGPHLPRRPLACFFKPHAAALTGMGPLWGCYSHPQASLVVQNQHSLPACLRLPAGSTAGTALAVWAQQAQHALQLPLLPVCC